MISLTTVAIQIVGTERKPERYWSLRNHLERIYRLTVVIRATGTVTPPPSLTSARNSCAVPASSQASGRTAELEGGAKNVIH